MNITRHNYEEYFLLYVDNELNIAQRKAVETFVEENPDLRAELIMLQQSVLPADDSTVFSGKQSLLKTTIAPNPVNENNCEEYFVGYADDELTNEQKDQVEQFIYRNPQHQAAFELLQQAKLMPDTAIVYPDKYALYRSEEEEKAPVIRMRWWRMAAAAVVLLFAGAMGWFIVTKNGSNGPGQPDSSFTVATRDSNNKKQPATTIPQQTPDGLADKSNTPGNTQDAAPEAAVITDKDKTNKQAQQQNQSLPKVITPVESATKEDITAVNPEKRKNNDAPDNKSVVTGTPPKETMASTSLKPQEVNGVDPTTRASINTVVKNRDLAVASVKPQPEPPIQPVATEEINPDEIFASDNDNNKKNKMRGFFRKVSRVFDKATNADPDNEKSSIRIASFEFALK